MRAQVAANLVKRVKVLEDTFELKEAKTKLADVRERKQKALENQKLQLECFTKHEKDIDSELKQYAKAEVNLEAPTLAKSKDVQTTLKAELDIECDQHLTAKYKTIADANLKACEAQEAEIKKT